VQDANNFDSVEPRSVEDQDFCEPRNSKDSQPCKFGMTHLSAPSDTKLDCKKGERFMGGEEEAQANLRPGFSSK